MKRTILALAGTVFAMAGHVAAAADLQAGRAAYERLNCASCHGADAKTSIDPSYPVLAGQYADYLRVAMRSYQRGQAGAPASSNVRTNPIMGAFAVQMSPEDIINISAWLESLPSDLKTVK
ncbi:MAG: c-type cytochrome [Pigmentiphaga sp.]|nr:c-type cytochrome [Pigmentiphaga sp.]